MKSRSILAIVLVIASSLAFAQASPKKYFDEIYAKLGKVMLKNDPVAAEKLLLAIGHKDFLYIGVHGQKQNGKQMIAQLKQQMVMVTSMDKSDVAIVKTDIKGDTAVVRTSMNYSMKMKNPQTKKNDVCVGKSVTDDTWKKVGTTWKLYRVKALSEDMTVNGKPFKM